MTERRPDCGKLPRAGCSRYICAIYTTMQIGQNHQIYDEYYKDSGGWDHEEYFGTVPKSMYTLFQVRGRGCP